MEENLNVLLVSFFLDLDDIYDLHGCTEKTDFAKYPVVIKSSGHKS